MILPGLYLATDERSAVLALNGVLPPPRIPQQGSSRAQATDRTLTSIFKRYLLFETRFVSMYISLRQQSTGAASVLIQCSPECQTDALPMRTVPN